MKHISVWWIACVLWCAAIFYMSNKPAVESQMESMYIVILANRLLAAVLGTGIVEITDGTVRKAAHFVEYLILGIFIFKALCRSVSPRTLLWLPLLAGIGYSISDEIHQLFVPGRTGRIFDIMVDSLGLALGVLLAMAASRMRRRSAERERPRCPLRSTSD